MRALSQVIAGVLFDFGSFLTTRPESITLGAGHASPPMIRFIQEFAALRSVSIAELESYDYTGFVTPNAQDEEHAELWRFMLRGLTEETPEFAVMAAIEEQFEEPTPEAFDAHVRAGLAEFKRLAALPPPGEEPEEGLDSLGRLP